VLINGQNLIIERNLTITWYAILSYIVWSLQPPKLPPHTQMQKQSLQHFVQDNVLANRRLSLPQYVLFLKLIGEGFKKTALYVLLLPPVLCRLCILSEVIA